MGRKLKGSQAQQPTPRLNQKPGQPLGILGRNAGEPRPGGVGRGEDAGKERGTNQAGSRVVERRIRN